MDWHKLPRPWNKEQCRRRYVEGGDEIGFRGLADESGRAKSTLQSWSKELKDGMDWQGQRVRFKSQLGTAVQQKTIERTSEKLADDLSEVAIANYKAHKLARDFAYLYLQIKAKHLSDIQLIPDKETQIIELAKKINTRDVNNIHQMMARATQEIASATGLPSYISLDTAFKRIEIAGYVILDPREEQEAQIE